MNCPACFEDLHCCRLCRHYLADATIACAEDRAEPPVHKEGANFCEFFRPSADAFRPVSKTRHASAKTNLDALFSGETGDADAEPDEARRKLDDLFR